MSGFNYSKWDKLELSDDEDTHHPNLDKNLNVRVNRITRDRKEEEIDTEKAKLEEQGKLEAAARLEAKRPLHVGNICKVAEERTIINRASGKSDRLVKDNEEFNVDDYVGFKKDNMTIFNEFTDCDWEKSYKMLVEHGGILLDECANSYFLLTALEEEMKGNKERVQKLGRQGQIISQIHQLAKPMKRPPRDLVHRFFEKFQHPEAQNAFQEGVTHFLGHIKTRAVEKKKEEAAEAAKAAEEAAQEDEAQEAVPLIEAMYEMTPEERKGPGGLDPVEVFESLPEALQNCFRSGDVDEMKKVASELEQGEFEKHFQRCIDAGLWNPG